MFLWYTSYPRRPWSVRRGGFRSSFTTDRKSLVGPMFLLDLFIHTEIPEWPRSLLPQFVFRSWSPLTWVHQFNRFPLIFTGIWCPGNVYILPGCTNFECTTKHSLLLARYQEGRVLWKAWRGVHGCGHQTGPKFMRQGCGRYSRCPETMLPGGWWGKDS